MIKEKFNISNVMKNYSITDEIYINWLNVSSELQTSLSLEVIRSNKLMNSGRQPRLFKLLEYSSEQILTSLILTLWCRLTELHSSGILQAFLLDFPLEMSCKFHSRANLYSSCVIIGIKQESKHFLWKIFPSLYKPVARISLNKFIKKSTHWRRSILHNVSIRWLDVLLPTIKLLSAAWSSTCPNFKKYL
jgi:hypothetical protein